MNVMRPGNASNARSAARRPAASPQLTMAMAGAVDLAAVKARSEAAARAAAAPPSARSGAIIDVTETDFQTEVLDRSYQVPVLINVTALNSPASAQLTPTLEKLATEGAGAWILASLDVDANPRMAQALQVQSIPAVFAVIAGQLVPGFTGALPEAQVREFVAAVLDAGAQSGLTTAPAPGPEETAAEPPSDPRFDAAEAALDAGDYPAAIASFQAILDVEPGNLDAALALRQTRFLQRLQGVPADALARAAATPRRRGRAAGRGRPGGGHEPGDRGPGPVARAGGASVRRRSRPGARPGAGLLRTARSRGRARSPGPPPAGQRPVLSCSSDPPVRPARTRSRGVGALAR